MTKQYFKYEGTGNQLALVLIKNFLLTVITLGIYRPWARTNFRRYIWSHVRFTGDRGAYDGTGRELFNGWALLVFYTIVFLVASRIVFTVLSFVFPEQLSALLISIATGAVYLYVFSVATYSGFRYRMSRTQWRQIRFGADRDKAKAKEFSILYIKGAVLTGLSLGIYYPYFKNNIHSYLVNRARIGTKNFRYDGKSSDYAEIYWIQMLLCFVTLGFYTPWFIQKTLQFRLQHTYLDQAQFGIDLRGKQLLVYGIATYLLLLLTFGLASPWIINWGYRLFTDHMYIDGAIDFESIKQAPAEGKAIGDEIVTDYELDFGF